MIRFFNPDIASPVFFFFGSLTRVKTFYRSIQYRFRNLILVIALMLLH